MKGKEPLKFFLNQHIKMTTCSDEAEEHYLNSSESTSEGNEKLFPSVLKPFPVNKNLT